MENKLNCQRRVGSDTVIGDILLNHPGIFQALSGNLGSRFFVCNLILAQLCRRIMKENCWVTDDDDEQKIKRAWIDLAH
jgi:hypothetical protein